MNNNKKYFSHNDIKRGLKMPNKINKDVAEETGIHAGDGHMNIIKHSTGTKYVYSISGGYEDERYFKSFLIPLMKRLYNIKPSIYRAKHEKSLTLHYQSKGLIYFKKGLGLPLGKKLNLKIPLLILKSPFRLDFIRGVFDTDGSLSFRKRYKKINYYPVIDIANKEANFIINIAKILKANKFSYSLNIDSLHKTRNGKLCKCSRIFIYGKTNLLKWMDLIGTSNPVKKDKFSLWKKYGYAPKWTAPLK